MNVGDVLRLKSIEGSKIVAGAEYTERPVTGVNVMEVPDIINWVRKGELLITSGYSYKDDPDSFADVIPLLAQKGVAAVGIKRKRYFADIPPKVIEAAKQCRMVLIELDERVVFSSVVKDIMTEVVSEEYYELTLLQDKVNRLSELLVQGEGIAVFLEQLSNLLSNPIVLVKENEEHLLFGLGEEAFSDMGISASLAEYMSEGMQGFFTIEADDTTYRIYAQTIMHRDEQLAELLVPEVNREFTNEDMYLLHQISYMVGLELISETIRTRTELRYVEQVIRDWILGKLESGSNLRMRAEICGIRIDETRRYRVLILRAASCNDQKMRYFLNRFQKSLRDCPDIYMTLLEHTIAAVVPEDCLHDYIRRLLAEGDYILGKQKLAICVGGESDKSFDLLGSYQEAMQICKICERKGTDKNVIWYDDIGVYSLLYQIPVDKTMDHYLDRYVTPLTAYDKEHESNLFDTLKTYVACKGNKKLTAEKLFTHYNTVSYRMDRIEQILHMDVEDSEIQFEIRLAIMLHDMYL